MLPLAAKRDTPEKKTPSRKRGDDTVGTFFQFDIEEGNFFSNDTVGNSFSNDTVGRGGMTQLETLIELDIFQFELFELILSLKLDKRLPVEQFEATVSQSTVPSPLLVRKVNPTCRARRLKRTNIRVDIIMIEHGLNMCIYIYIYLYIHTFWRMVQSQWYSAWSDNRKMQGSSAPRLSRLERVVGVLKTN